MRSSRLWKSILVIAGIGIAVGVGALVYAQRRLDQPRTELRLVVGGAINPMPPAGAGNDSARVPPAGFRARVVPDTGMLLGVYRFDPGEVRVVDDETFELLTLVLPPFYEDTNFTLPSNSVQVYYCNSGITWASCLLGELVTHVTGRVHLRGNESWPRAVVAKIDLSFDLPASAYREASRRRFDMTGHFIQVSEQQFTEVR